MNEPQEQPIEDDDFLDDIMGAGTPKPRFSASPEDDFYRELTGNNGEKYPKISNIRWWLNHEMSSLQHLRESGVVLSILGDIPDAQPIPGAVAKPATSARKQLRPLTNTEFIKLRIEYYMLMHYHPRFQVIPDQPQRRICSMSKIVDMVAEYETIKQLVTKRY